MVTIYILWIDGLADGGDGDDIIGISGAAAGGNGNDFITGWIGNDTLDGGEGNDTINGWGGNDLIAGGAGDDIINGGIDRAGADQYGSDTIYGGQGNDQLFGDYVFGEEGNDFITGIIAAYGGSGDDTVSGNLVSGGEGNDVLSGKLVYGGAGNDTISAASPEGSIVHGEDGNDYFRLGGSDSRVFAGAGNDIFEIDFASDRFNPDARPILNGDAGADRYDITYANDTGFPSENASSNFRINDFNLLEDRLNILVKNYTAEGRNDLHDTRAIKFAQSTVIDGLSSTELVLNAIGTHDVKITLVGVHISLLNQVQFV
jgi:Ca2+-binding RTX toxin-like protein